MTTNVGKSGAVAVVVAPPRPRAGAVAVAVEAHPVPVRHDDDTFNGTRKLIRPHLPPISERRLPTVHTDDPLTHATLSDQHGAIESSHAEAFYFQKQMQQQTEMTVILEDGEQLNGIIQWYDKCVVKLRVGRNRVLVYKAGIKYLYKASEDHPTAGVMK